MKTSHEALTIKKQSPWKKHWLALLILVPALLEVLIFKYLPLIGIVIAFKDFNILQGIWGSSWVGLENFKEIFSNPDMLKAVKNTLINGVALTFGGFPFPIVLALLFNELRCAKFKKVSQTLTYMPHFLSWISVVGLFYAFFATEGSFNMFMAKIFGDSWEAKNILLDSKNFLPIIFWSHIWKAVGWSSIVFLAAITGIDDGLYEAATLDGCGRLKQTWYITLPSIKGTIVVVLVMSLGSLVTSSFDQVYGFQNLFTQEDTEVIQTLIYRQGIQGGKYSLASAFGLSQGIVQITLIMMANFLSKKLMQTSIW